MEFRNGHPMQERLRGYMHNLWCGVPSWQVHQWGSQHHGAFPCSFPILSQLVSYLKVQCHQHSYLGTGVSSGKCPVFTCLSGILLGIPVSRLYCIWEFNHLDTTTLWRRERGKEPLHSCVTAPSRIWHTMQCLNQRVKGSTRCLLLQP